jgi:hypothetical protein
MRRFMLAGLLCLLLQAPVARLWGQATSPSTPAAQAKTAYLQGVMAMGRLDYRQAVTTFTTATQLSPTNTVYAEALRLARQKLRDSTTVPLGSTP